MEGKSMRRLHRLLLASAGRHPVKCGRPLLYGGIIGLLVLLLGAGQISSPSVPSSPVAGTAANPLDLPLRLIAEARQSYQATRDYTCMFVKRERIRGAVQPDN